MSEATLTEKEFAAIGKVAQQWARLEMQVHLLITGLLGHSNPHHMLVGPAMGSRLAFEFAAGLASLVFEDMPQKDAAAKLMSRAGGLASRRNTVLHSPWGRGKNSKSLVPLGLKVRQTIQDLGPPQSETAFLALASEIHALSVDIWRFAQESGLARPLSP